MEVRHSLVYLSENMDRSIVTGPGLPYWEEGRIPCRLAPPQDPQMEEAQDVGSDPIRDFFVP